MHIQNLSELGFFIISTSETFKSLYFRFISLRYNKHSSKLLHLTDLLQMLQVTLADNKLYKFKKRKKMKKKRMKICND